MRYLRYFFCMDDEFKLGVMYWKYYVIYVIEI